MPLVGISGPSLLGDYPGSWGLFGSGGAGVKHILMLLGPLGTSEQFLLSDDPVG